VKVIENKFNYGFAKANNIAIKESNSKYVFLLNPDTILINNVVNIFYNFMEKEGNLDFSCIGGTIFNEDNSLQESFGKYPSIKQILFEFGLKSIFPNFYNENLSTGFKDYKFELKEVEHIIGAGMFIRRDVLNKIGYFDEDFFLYYEETELCYRMKKNNFKLFYVPESKLLHYKGKSESPTINKLKIIEQSKYLFFEKCYGFNTRIIANLLYIIKFLLAYLLTFNKKYSQLLVINLNIFFNLNYKA
jgi:GT2 family glycosyltransferase